MFGDMSGWLTPGTEHRSVVSFVHVGLMVSICVGRYFREMKVGGFGWAEFLTWERVLMLLWRCTWGEGFLQTSASSKGGGSIVGCSMARPEVCMFQGG